MATEKVVIFSEWNGITLAEKVNVWIEAHPNLDIVERLLARNEKFATIAIFYHEVPEPKRPAKAARPPRGRGKLTVAK